MRKLLFISFLIVPQITFKNRMKMTRIAVISCFLTILSLSGVTHSENTTTTTTTKTTTTASTTTTFAPNTTTPATNTTTTTAAPTTTTAPSLPVVMLKAPETNPCLLLKTSIKFHITYISSANTTKKADFVLPSDASAEGQCDIQLNNDTNVQKMTIGFNSDWELSLTAGNEKQFTAETNGDSYAVYQVKLMGKLNDGRKINLENKVDAVNGSGSLENLFVGSVNKSVACSQYSVTLGDLKEGDVSVVMDFGSTKFQAYVPHRQNATFSEAMDCAADEHTSDLIPIIVGGCLAALVIIVLIAYLIGRARQRRAGYQSV